MTLAIELVDEPAEPAPQECHAQISITAGAKGLEIESVCINEPNNPAVKFAKWVGEHSQELFTRMEKEQAGPQLVTDVTPRIIGANGPVTGEVRLVGADGETLQ